MSTIPIDFASMPIYDQLFVDGLLTTIPSDPIVADAFDVPSSVVVSGNLIRRQNASFWSTLGWDNWTYQLSASPAGGWVSLDEGEVTKVLKAWQVTSDFENDGFPPDHKFRIAVTPNTIGPLTAHGFIKTLSKTDKETFISIAATQAERSVEAAESDAPDFWDNFGNALPLLALAAVGAVGFMFTNKFT